MASFKFDDVATTAAIRRLVQGGLDVEALRELLTQPVFTLNLPNDARSSLARLPRYAADMVDACNDLGVEANKRVKMSTFRKVLCCNAPVTLEQVLAVDHMLNSVAASDYNKLRGRVSVMPPQNNAKSMPFRLPNNCVICRQ